MLEMSGRESVKQQLLIVPKKIIETSVLEFMLIEKRIVVKGVFCISNILSNLAFCGQFFIFFLYFVNLFSSRSFHF